MFLFASKRESKSCILTRTKTDQKTHCQGTGITNLKNAAWGIYQFSCWGLLIANKSYHSKSKMY